MHSVNKIDIYEVNGIEQTNYVGDPDCKLEITSHDNKNSLIVINIPGASSVVTVSALDLLKAVNNATNV